MPSSVTTTSGARTLLSVDQGAHTAQYNMTGSWVNAQFSPTETLRKRIRVLKNGVLETTTSNGNTTALSGSWDSNDNGQTDPICEADNNTYSWHARIVEVDADEGDINQDGDILYFTSAAVTAVANAPVVTNITSSGADVSCGYYPNVLHSTSSAQIQYKRTVDSTWTNFGTPGSTTGYSIQSEAETLTGLTASTSYDVRLVITRTTVNATSTTSATTTFVTAAAAPSVTTTAATTIAFASAYANADVVTNGFSTDVSFEWDTNSGAPYANETTPAQTVATDQSVSKQITSLTASTTYYFRAKAVYSGGTVYGSELTFDTTAADAAGAEDQEMLPIQDFDRKYGVQTTVYFVVPVVAATSSNAFYTGAAVWDGAGESKVSKDGAAFADTTNDPAQVEGQLYSLTLTAAEMQCNEAFVIISNSSTAVRDIALRVRTHLQLGSVDIDAATGQKANTTGVTITGYGSGHGLSAVAGATGKDIDGVPGDMVMRSGTCQTATGTGTEIKFDSSASATNDYYNGAIVIVTAGTGAGQGRVITDYVGSTKVATVHKAWSTNPTNDSTFVILGGPDPWEIPNTAELASVPAITGTWRELLAFVVQRFKFKRTMTATSFKMFKDDGSTELGSGATVTDDGSTQTHGEYT